jgi:hypothetical protein
VALSSFRSLITSTEPDDGATLIFMLPVIVIFFLAQRLHRRDHADRRQG